MSVFKFSSGKFFYGLAAAFAVPALALTGIGLLQQSSQPKAVASTPPGAGQWAYIDEDGNLIPRPADQPAPSLPEKSVVESEEFDLEDGGVGIRNPRVSYTYAVRSEDGAVAIHCKSIDRDSAHACSTACDHLPAIDPAKE